MAGTRYYLASRYERRSEMLEYARVLAEFEQVVTSDWILGKHEGRVKLEWAMENLANIRDSDCVIYFSDLEVSRSRFVEYGIALGLGKRIVIIGDNQETPFHTLGVAHKYKDWNEFRCAVLESTLQTQKEKLALTNIGDSELSLSEQKLDQNKAIYQFPQPYSTDLQQNPSTFPQDQT